MKGLRRFTVAFVVASVMALGPIGLEAQGKGKGKGGTPEEVKAAICSYLWTVMNYEYASPEIKAYAAALFAYYECTPPTAQ